MRLDCPHIQDHEALGYLPLGTSTQPGGGPLLRPRRELLALGARAREEVHVAGRTGRVVGGLRPGPVAGRLARRLFFLRRPPLRGLWSRALPSRLLRQRRRASTSAGTNAAFDSGLWV